MHRNHTVVLIIPALDEENAIVPLLAQVDRSVVDWIVVVDNGSRDRKAERAASCGAIVLHEDRRGYGSACLKGLREGPGADIVVFMDGDGSDDPLEIEKLLTHLSDREADFVIGSRVVGLADPKALTPVQWFGNTLTCALVRLFWGVRFTDLGPFRAIRRTALDRLEMADPDFGWTIEMQVKAAQRGLRTTEIPVRYRVRAGGRSKVSGTVSGVFHAGTRILGYVLLAKWNELPRV